MRIVNQQTPTESTSIIESTSAIPSTSPVKPASVIACTSNIQSLQSITLDTNFSLKFGNKSRSSRNSKPRRKELSLLKLNEDRENCKRSVIEYLSEKYKVLEQISKSDDDLVENNDVSSTSKVCKWLCEKENETVDDSNNANMNSEINLDFHHMQSNKQLSKTNIVNVIETNQLKLQYGRKLQSSNEYYTDRQKLHLKPLNVSRSILDVTNSNVENSLPGRSEAPNNFNIQRQKVSAPVHSIISIAKYCK